MVVIVFMVMRLVMAFVCTLVAMAAAVEGWPIQMGAL
jgi:hypothetical protein